MIKYIFIVLILVLNISTYSQLNISEYFPNEKGSKWDYLYNENSIAYIQVTDNKSDTSYFYYDSKLTPKSYSKFETSVYYLKGDSILLLAKGTYLFDDNIDFWENPTLFLKSNIEKGNVYITENEFRKYNFELVDIYPTLEILGKEFKDIIEIKSVEDDKKICYRFYAKNVGLIREDEIIENKRKTILELKKYQLTKKD